MLTRTLTYYTAFMPFDGTRKLVHLRAEVISGEKPTYKYISVEQREGIESVLHVREAPEDAIHLTARKLDEATIKRIVAGFNHGGEEKVDEVMLELDIQVYIQEINKRSLLMFKPTARISEQPLIDELTRKMTAAWRNCRTNPDGYMGFHRCACGAESDNKDHWVKSGDRELMTNSLAIHYLAFHRDEIPDEELQKVASLEYGEAEPTEVELQPRWALYQNK